ncbi:hypothetical protein Tco_0891212 [Tanacetum coccineum]|uniref:Uncharacterized protein n=1 Tax=Tanacetum coccineum TaxID=301880 RepID=A0ABQ5C2L3_9ASTR
MTSTSVESVNALTKDVRNLPITMLMDWYRDLLQKWYYERRDKHEDAPGDELTEWDTAKVNTRMLKTANWTVKVARFVGLSSIAQLAKTWFLNKNLKDYVMDTYGDKWLLENNVNDEILDDLLKREFKIQQRSKRKGTFKDDKANQTGTHILDDLQKENNNVEDVLNNLKNKKLKVEKEVIMLDSDTTTKSMEKRSLSDIPSSTHPYETVSNNAFNLRLEDTCNSNETWEPKKLLKNYLKVYFER